MSISFKELLHRHIISDVPVAHQQNLQELQKRVNIIREAWGKPMIVTSGYRSEQDQLRIYRGKGFKDKDIPMGSAHLSGQAVDFADKDGSLYKWLKEDFDKNKDNSLLVKARLFMEKGTVGWIHLQSRPTVYRVFRP